jgi:hypothetical protein
MQQTIEGARTRVDALRSAVESDPGAGERLRAEPLGLLESLGFMGAFDSRSVVGADAAFHPGEAVQSCPWHTCQNTRHRLPE